MLGVVVFLVALFAMFAWFAYLFAKDPANLFKRDERAQRRRDFGRDAGSDPIVTPIDAGRSERGASETFTPGGGDFGGAGTSGDWSSDAGNTGGSDSGSGDGNGGSGD